MFGQTKELIITMKKVLVIVTTERMPNNDVMYQEFAKFCELTIKKITKHEQKNLKKCTTGIDFRYFDEVLIDLHFKRIYKQHRFFRKMERVNFLEEDMCQNYISNSHWTGKFLKFYKKVGKCKVLSSGHYFSQKMRLDGIETSYVGKAYDQELITDRGNARTVDYGFIGRIRNTVYTGRREFLETLAEEIELDILRTEPGEDYVKALSKIKFFISADIGLGEYMIKNFEAMGAGCILCAYLQGNGEEEALGLIDMENVILYTSVNQLLEKLKMVGSDNTLANKIAENGRKLANQSYTYKSLAHKLVKGLDL
jgi:hypothetical protein